MQQPSEGAFELTWNCLLCFVACGVRGRNQKIVGGSETHPNEYPWVAGLFKQNKLYCGATVISNRFLLTVIGLKGLLPDFLFLNVSLFMHPAGRSLRQLIRTVRDSGEYSYRQHPSQLRSKRNKKSPQQAFVGGHNISRDYTEIKRIKKIIPHEDFDIFTFNNDIALLELETPLFYSSRVAPACLPSGTQQDFTDQLTLVAGWGRLSERSPTSQTLRSVVVPVWSQDECLMAGYGSTRITENMMCGGYPEGQRDR